MDSQINTANNIKMTGKQYMKKEKNTYCLVCRKKVNNKEIRGVTLVNEVATQRSLCTDCTSKKPTSLKPIKPITNKTNKKQK